MQTLHVSLHLDASAPASVTLHMNGHGGCDPNFALPTAPDLPQAEASPAVSRNDDDYVLGGYAGI